MDYQAKFKNFEREIASYNDKIKDVFQQKKEVEFEYLSFLCEYPQQLINIITKYINNEGSDQVTILEIDDLVPTHLKKKLIDAIPYKTIIEYYGNNGEILFKSKIYFTAYEKSILKKFHLKVTNMKIPM